MKRVCIIHAGIGKVGKQLIRQLYDLEKQIKKDYHFHLFYCGLFNSVSGVYATKEIPLVEIADDPLKHFFRIENTEYIMADIIKKTVLPFIFIDTTASQSTYPLILTALEKGGYAVLSNKKPLSDSQKLFDILIKNDHHHLFFETTVGAGLPVISTLKSLIHTGDKVVQIQGCFSGTLGYIFSQMEEGVSFSAAVKNAKQNGFTEPDPRDDLSGKDVARKALILARLCGYKLELSDIKLQGLYPSSMQKISREQFMQLLPQLDLQYKKKMNDALRIGKTLRFVATFGKGICQVGMKEVDRGSDIGSLRGPDNLIVFKTKRYFTNPLVIKGPGAGVEITASGVVSDILQILVQLQGENA